MKKGFWLEAGKRLKKKSPDGGPTRRAIKVAGAQCSRNRGQCTVLGVPKSDVEQGRRQDRERTERKKGGK